MLHHPHRSVRRLSHAVGPDERLGRRIRHSSRVLNEYLDLAGRSHRADDVALHVAEPERAVGPPERTFGELEAPGDFLDDGAWRDQRVERRVQTLDLADADGRRGQSPRRRQSHMSCVSMPLLHLVVEHDRIALDCGHRFSTAATRAGGLSVESIAVPALEIFARM